MALKNNNIQQRNIKEKGNILQCWAAIPSGQMAIVSHCLKIG